MKESNYDSKYDVLYISLADMSNSYGDEDPDGIVVHRDLCTDSITGITIFGFFKRISDSSAPKIELPNSIAFERDILPLLQRS